jgi:hypothetical protein
VKRIALLSRPGPLRLPIQPTRLFPSLLKDGVQLRQKTVAVDAEHAKVVMKSLRRHRARGVFDTPRRRRRPAHGNPGHRDGYRRRPRFNWIAKLNQTVASAGFKRFPQLEIQADPGKKLTVASSASDRGNGGYYSCGPVMSTFSPEKAKVYLVEFQFKLNPAACATGV